jgi:hypothetical protein
VPAVLVVGALGPLIEGVATISLQKLAVSSGEQKATDPLLSFHSPGKRSCVCSIGIVSGWERLLARGQDLFKGIREGLRAKTLAGEIPKTDRVEEGYQ